TISPIGQVAVPLIVAEDGIWVGDVRVSTVRATAVARVDINNDFRTDLAVSTSTGLEILSQTEDGRFVPIARSALRATGLDRTAIRRIWSADVDLDGDLDLVVAPASAGPCPTVSRSRSRCATSARPTRPWPPAPRSCCWTTCPRRRSA
ncbi:MAG: hypothetical protein CVU59_12350, partial [Deltaproteobacteria bacterium HGW-Deltaproteobacteria-17]